MPSSGVQTCALDRKSTRLNSSHTLISYAVFCLEKKSGSEEHTSELQSHSHLVCRLLLEEIEDAEELCLGTRWRLPVGAYRGMTMRCAPGFFFFKAHGPSRILLFSPPAAFSF